MSITLKRRGTLFVLAAPSGGGKSVVLHALLEEVEGLAYSISVTSRPPREGEKEGVDYRFVSGEAFRAMAERGEFYEWAEVHGNLYGTPKAAVEALLAQGLDVAMDIDVQGARSVKKTMPEAVTVFLLPPSIDLLERRLRDRGTDDEEAIRVRLGNAAREIAECRLFDYLVVNDDLGRVIEQVQAIVRAERSRGGRQELIVENEPDIEANLPDEP